MNFLQRFSRGQSFIPFPTTLAGEYPHNTLTPPFDITPWNERTVPPAESKPAKKAR